MKGTKLTITKLLKLAYVKSFHVSASPDKFFSCVFLFFCFVLFIFDAKFLIDNFPTIVNINVSTIFISVILVLSH